MKIKKNYLDTKKSFSFLFFWKLKRDQTFHYHYVCDTMPSYVSYKYACMFGERKERERPEKTDISYFNPREFYWHFILNDIFTSLPMQTEISSIFHCTFFFVEFQKSMLKFKYETSIKRLDFSFLLWFEICHQNRRWNNLLVLTSIWFLVWMIHWFEY